MTQDESLQYWQSMRSAMEDAGDTSSAIYKRALAISQGLPDPLAAEFTLPITRILN